MRKKRTTKRRASTRRTSVAKRPTVRRRRSTKKGFLSEMFNPMQAQASAKVLISGAIGGVGAGLLSKIYPTTATPQMKAVYTIAGGFIASVALKMPNVGAGMAGVGVYNLLQSQGMLAEGDSGYDYANDLEALPMVLNEGEAQYLAENGGMYLSEDYLAEDDDDSYQVPYAPSFGGF